MNITLFIPALNEYEGLKEFLPLIPKNTFCQVLVADGNSQDGTVQLVQELGYDVYVQKNKGIRSAYVEAWPLIKGDYVMTMSPDGNCLMDGIPRLIEKLKEGYDLVIASRYLPPAHSEDDDVITGFGNWMFTTLTNVLYSGNFTDVLGIFRVYRKNLFYELDLHKDESWPEDKIFHTQCGVEPLMSIRAAKRKLKIAEVPSNEPKRTTGKRKVLIFRWGSMQLSYTFREKFMWK